MLPLPDSDSETDSDKNGFDSNVQKCFHWTDSETYACSDSDSNSYCTHFCHQYRCNKPIATVILLCFAISTSANVICTLVKMPGNRIYHQKQACRQQRIRRMKLFLMFMMFEMQMVHREVWIHPLNVERVSKGEFYRLYLDQRHFPEKFFENYCMSMHQFDEILNKIDPLVRKKDINFRKAITPEEKLALTLR